MANWCIELLRICHKKNCLCLSNFFKGHIKNKKHRLIGMNHIENLNKIFKRKVKQDKEKE